MKTRILRGEDAVKHIQTGLREEGFYDGGIDGLWGPLSETSFAAMREAARLRCEAEIPEVVPHIGRKLAWGSHLEGLPHFSSRPGSAETFRDRVFWMEGPEGLDMPEGGASDLMSAMAWENDETFRSDITNYAGSGATGLIQFMPNTAVGLGTTTAKLALMTPEDQLNYVFKYFRPWKGKLKNLGDVYMAILWPLAVGKPDSFELWNRNTRPTTYRQNAGLDVNKDGSITRGEAVSKVLDKLKRGLQPPRVWIEGA